MNRISRRTVISGAAALPFVAVGLRSVIAQDDSTPESTPMGSPEASPGASPMASPSAGGEEITVVAVDIAFEQEEITIPANTDVTITLTNEGMLEHDLVVDELDFIVGPLAGGESASETLNAPAGEYEYYCSIPGHKEAGMVGTLIVE
jgi:nitrite reductase (NO-forming)